MSHPTDEFLKDCQEPLDSAGALLTDAEAKAGQMAAALKPAVTAGLVSAARQLLEKASQDLCGDEARQLFFEAIELHRKGDELSLVLATAKYEKALAAKLDDALRVIAQRNLDQIYNARAANRTADLPPLLQQLKAVLPPNATGEQIVLEVEELIGCVAAQEAEVEQAFQNGHKRGFRVGTELGEMADEGAINAKLRAYVAELEGVIDTLTRLAGEALCAAGPTAELLGFRKGADGHYVCIRKEPPRAEAEEERDE